MKRFIEGYKGETFDVVVIGGGISGAAVAYDAASRGLTVALVEKQDFGGATSAATSKLIHGGFRYLANLELGMVRESLRERRILENIAPNLVRPIPVLIPCYDSGITRNKHVLRGGMALYDLLSFDKGRTWDRSQRIGLHRTMPRPEALALEPIIPPDGLTGAFIYYDCRSLFPERLTLAFIRSAVKHGAGAANYCKAEGFIFSSADRKRIAGVRVRDLINNREHELSAKLTINCCGPWADLILGLVRDETSAHRIRRSEGIHVIVKNLVNQNMVVFITPSGKGVFLIPWRGHTLIGTTDKEYAGDPDDFRVTRPAILELLETVNGCLQGRARLGYEDVIAAYGGLRPLVEDRSKDVHKSSRKYEIHDHAPEGLEGLLTVEGGKYTTSRGLAQKVMSMVAKKLGRELGECVTDKRRLAGCEIKDLENFPAQMKAEHRDFPEKTVECLARYYGSECGAVLELARGDERLVEPLNDEGEIMAQAVYACRNEMAMTLADVLFRRTGAGALGRPGGGKIARIADLAAAELGWDENRKTHEIEQAEKRFKLPES